MKTPIDDYSTFAELDARVSIAEPAISAGIRCDDKMIASNRHPVHMSLEIGQLGNPTQHFISTFKVRVRLVGVGWECVSQDHGNGHHLMSTNSRMRKRNFMIYSILDTDCYRLP